MKFFTGSVSTCTLILIAVLLIVQQPVNAQNYVAGPDTTPELKILSWNIHMLPYCIYAKTKKRKRYREIVKEMNQSDYDIIVFQEAFHNRVRRKMWRRMNEVFPYQYGPANKKAFTWRPNSGIWIVSKTPLIELDEIAFENCVGDGCLARKGVLMVQGNWYGHLFQILGTHMNGGHINNSQFHELREKLLDPYQKEGVAQIICGDFNTKTTSADDQWNTLLRTFDVDTGYVQYDDRDSLHKAEWPVADVCARFPDFFFVRSNGDKDLAVRRMATVSYGPCWKQEPKKIYLRSVGLSDHYPVRMVLQWKNK